MKYLPNQLVLIVVLGCSSIASAGVVDFDSLSHGATGAQIDAYLSSYGITISNATLGSSVGAQDDRITYGGGIVAASSGHIYLAQWGGGNPVTYTLNFEPALVELSFTRITELPGSGGTAYPWWEAKVFAGASQVGYASESLHAIWPGESNPAHVYSFSHEGITSIQFTGDHYGYAAFSQVMIDDLTLTPVPEPCGWVLAMMGALGLAIFGWLRNR